MSCFVKNSDLSVCWYLNSMFRYLNILTPEKAKSICLNLHGLFITDCLETLQVIVVLIGDLQQINREINKGWPFAFLCGPFWCNT